MYEKKPWLAHYGSVPHSINYPRVTMYEALLKTVARYSDCIAYDFLGYTSTYNHFAEEIDCCANALAALSADRASRQGRRP